MISSSCFLWNIVVDQCLFFFYPDPAPNLHFISALDLDPVPDLDLDPASDLNPAQGYLLNMHF
jgi:hypothetical protein